MRVHEHPGRMQRTAIGMQGAWHRSAQVWEGPFEFARWLGGIAVSSLEWAAGSQAEKCSVAPSLHAWAWWKNHR